MPDWVNQGFTHYQKQIGRRVNFQLIEVPPLKRNKGADISRIIKQEEAKILNAIPDSFRIVALERLGKQWDSLKLANKLGDWMDAGQPTAFVIGGPEGLSDEFLNKCDETWSFSMATLSHTIARLVLAEQIYRGLTILEGGPYHR